MPKTQAVEEKKTSKPLTGGAGILDDEMPQPPPSNVGNDVPFETGAAFSGVVPEDLWKTIPDENEALKDGIYKFRLDGFKKGYTQKWDETEKKQVDDLNKPLYKLQWKCQEEPYVGRVVFDNRMSWAADKDIVDAANANSPRCMEARKLVNDRMKAPRMFMKAIGVQLSTFDNDFDKFLSTNPECRIRVRASEAKEKVIGSAGKPDYKGTGKMTNNDIKEYLPLSGR